MNMTVFRVFVGVGEGERETESERCPSIYHRIARNFCSTKFFAILFKMANLHN